MIFQLNQPNNSQHSKLYIRGESPNPVNLEAAKKILLEEYGKYPIIIEKSALKVVNLVSNLRVKNNVDIDKFVPVSQSPDPEAHMMYVDVDYVSNESYFRQCTNHEIWHLYDFATSGSFAPADKEWESLNPSTFKYGQGGWVGYHTLFENKFHPMPGFITTYAALGIDEDKAEIFMYYFTDHLRPELEKALTSDALLSQKLEMILQKCS